MDNTEKFNDSGLALDQSIENEVKKDDTSLDLENVDNKVDSVIGVKSEMDINAMFSFIKDQFMQNKQEFKEINDKLNLKFDQNKQENKESNDKVNFKLDQNKQEFKELKESNNKLNLKLDEFNQEIKENFERLGEKLDGLNGNIVDLNQDVVIMCQKFGSSNVDEKVIEKVNNEGSFVQVNNKFVEVISDVKQVNGNVEELNENNVFKVGKGIEGYVFEKVDLYVNDFEMNLINGQGLNFKGEVNKTLYEIYDKNRPRLMKYCLKLMKKMFKANNKRQKLKMEYKLRYLKIDVKKGVVDIMKSRLGLHILKLPARRRKKTTRKSGGANVKFRQSSLG